MSKKMGFFSRIWSGFSALQRAENSSMYLSGYAVTYREGFSALQRAENSSIFHPPLVLTK